jgi:uncharacterized membrane protein
VSGSLAAWQTQIGGWPMGEAVSGVVWIKALLESVHILAMGLVMFVVAVTASRSGVETVRRFAPWVWGGLAVVVVTGLVLLTGAGSGRGMATPMFQLKMALLLAAVAATALIQVLLETAPAWRTASPRHRIAAKAIAYAGLLLWMATACAGRWLAYGYILFAPA